MKKSGGCLGWSVVIAVEEIEGEEEAAEGKALGGEAGRRLLRLNRRGKDRFGATVGTMTVGLWGENGEGRSHEGDGGRDRPTLVVRQTRDGQLRKAGWLWFPKDERPKREKGGSEMAGGPWLSGSGRAKSKDPGGWWLRFLKIPKWGP